MSITTEIRQLDSYVGCRICCKIADKKSCELLFHFELCIINF